MRTGRISIAVILLTIVFLSFTVGFFTGRLTAGDTFTISTEYRPEPDTAVPALAVKQTGAPSEDADRQTEEPAGSPKGEDTAFPVNINTAGEDELMRLPSIGKTRADSIIAYREEFGLFISAAEIMQVPGIGEAIYDDIKPYITVGN